MIWPGWLLAVSSCTGTVKKRRENIVISTKESLAMKEKLDQDVVEEGPPQPLKGVYMFPNGDKYDGEINHSVDGVIMTSGYGKHQSVEGVVYEGNWQEDKMNGRGKLVHPSGAIYEGDFSNNMMHGQGKYIFPDASVYEGPFLENRMQGHGDFTDSSGQVWTGMFNGKNADGLKFKLSM